MTSSILLSGVGGATTVATAAGTSTPTAATGVLIAGVTLPQALAIALVAAALVTVLVLVMRCCSCSRVNSAAHQLSQFFAGLLCSSGKAVENLQVTMHLGGGSERKIEGRYTGWMVNDLPDGKGEFQAEVEGVTEVREGTFKKGEITEGSLTRQREDGDELEEGYTLKTWEGAFQGNLPCGQGHATFANGETFDGTFANGKMQWGTLTRKDDPRMSAPVKITGAWKEDQGVGDVYSWIQGPFERSYQVKLNLKEGSIPGWLHYTNPSANELGRLVYYSENQGHRHDLDNGEFTCLWLETEEGEVLVAQKGKFASILFQTYGEVFWKDSQNQYWKEEVVFDGKHTPKKTISKEDFLAAINAVTKRGCQGRVGGSG